MDVVAASEECDTNLSLAVPPAPEPRQTVTIQEDVSPSLERVKVLSWNILCDRYATSTVYGYTPSNALAWEYRKDLILEELRRRDADFLCFQEITHDPLEAHPRHLNGLEEPAGNPNLDGVVLGTNTTAPHNNQKQQKTETEIYAAHIVGPSHVYAPSTNVSDLIRVRFPTAIASLRCLLDLSVVRIRISGHRVT